MRGGYGGTKCPHRGVGTRSVPTFDRVRGVIAGATLTIMCETPAAVEIEWMVIAERADPFIKQWDRTNPDGYLVTQYSSAEAPVASVAPSGDAQSSPAGAAGLASVPTPLSGGASAPTPPSSGEEAAPVAPAEEPAAPAEDPAAPAAPADPVAPSAPSE